MDEPKKRDELGRFPAGVGGRPKGTPNKLTKTVKEAFEVAFQDLQGKPGVKLSDWAANNPTDFYKIASKLIPSELNANVSGNLAGILGSIGPGQGKENDPPVA